MKNTSDFTAFLKKTIGMVVDFLFPPACPYCDKIIDSRQIMCDSCFEKIRFIKAPKCYRCSKPLPTSATSDEKLLCTDCLAKRPVYDLARSCFVYDSFSRQTILKLKYFDRTDLRLFFAHYLMLSGADVIEKCDVVLPIPMFWSRRFKRGYNQAALLAELVAKQADKPYYSHVLLRVRSTESQTRKTAEERRKNLKNAFEIAHKELISNKCVLLIDDVLTTGSTGEACAKELKKAGAKAVYLLTIARAIKE